MKSRQLFILALLLAATTLFTSETALASHFRGGNLSWTPTATAGQVKFSLLSSFRRTAYSGSGSDGRPVVGDIITEAQGGTVFFYGDGGNTGTLRFRVTAYSVTENWILGEALHPSTNNPGILHTYAGAGPYTAEINDCCRLDAGLNNRLNGNYRVATVVRPTSGNSSPISSIVPIVTVPRAASAGSTSSFFVPAADPNGDNVTFRLSNSTIAEEGGGAHPTGLSINSTTGEVTWANFSLNGTNFWTTQIIVEDRDASGNVKTQNAVDFLLRIGTPVGSPPTIEIDPAGTETVYSGDLTSFTVTGSDVDASAVVSLNGAGIPSGATLTPDLPTSGASGLSTTFAWTPTTAQAGTYVMNFSATDENGQQALASKTLIVVNNRPPTADAGDDQSVQCDGGSSTPVTLDGTGSSDPDSDPLSYEWRDASSTVIGTTATLNITQGLGSQTYTLTVDDGNGETDVDDVTVTVYDDIAPVPTVATLPTVTGECSATITEAPTASDGCAGTITGTTTDPLSYSTQGTHTVHWTFDDGNGNTSSQDQTVVVDDVTAPTITVTLTPASLWPPNHRLREITAVVTTSDNCTTPTWTLTSITSNEPENGLGDGDTPDDWQNDATGTADDRFDLRAERSGSGTGRVYTVTYTADDGNGNTASASATVTVAASGGKLTVTPAETGGVALTGNQPNPFSQSTTINYMLPSQSDVALTIYNSDGQIVRDLAVGTRSAGAQSTTWDGLDNDGRPTASGVYFCQLRVGDIIVLSTMNLTR